MRDSHTGWYAAALVLVALHQATGEVGTARNTPALTSGPVPRVEWFAVVSNAEANIPGNAHSVAGMGTADGGFVRQAHAAATSFRLLSPPPTQNQVASGTYSVGTTDDQNGFVVKIDRDGNYKWVHKIPSLGAGTNKYESVLSVAEGPAADNYAVYGVGIIWTGSTEGYDRVIVKLDSATGARIWLKTFPDPTPGLNGGHVADSLPVVAAKLVVQMCFRCVSGGR